MSDTIFSAKTQAPSNEMIERVACAMAAKRDDTAGRGAAMDVYGDLAAAAIEAHVAALAADGLVIVPREPTEAMLTAGEDSLEYTQVCRSLRNMGLEAWRSMTEAVAA